MAREDFLEYCGLKKDKSGKEMFSGSFSGIDGGDIDAEYWFMGMEWSDISDINNDYSYVYDKWINVEEMPDHVDIKTNPGKWELENKLDILYHKLMPESSGGKIIFEKDSNTLKLNLLPLPFSSDDAKNIWNKTRLTETTGFSCFDEYVGEKHYPYENSVILARKQLFQELLKKGNKPKTIFCFGKGYEDKFVRVLTDNQRYLKLEIKLPDSKCNGSNLKATVYNVNSQKINRIIISPFPYYKKVWKFTLNDWEKIRFIATEDWQTICDLAKE